MNERAYTFTISGVSVECAITLVYMRDHSSESIGEKESSPLCSQQHSVTVMSLEREKRK